MDTVENNSCPSCGTIMLFGECDECGFAEGLTAGNYETPEGNIVTCSEEEAYERGYISICPECLFQEITWWEREDHGMCITCWHKRNTESR
jgi:hypothetical protein